MSLLRRVVSVTVGLAASCAAVALAYHYHNKHTEGPADVSAEAPNTVPEQDQAPAPSDETVYVPVTRAVPKPDEPNVNPVADVVDDKPPVVDGKIDPTRIASPEDFADWSEYGCQG
ncbi:MAG: hypothetical protein ACI4OL_02945 [Gemmiger sp.]